MAATPINVGSITRATAQISEVNGDSVNGNSFTNDGRTLLSYRNAGATPRSMSIVTTKTVGPDNIAVSDWFVAVAASSDWVPLGFFDIDIFGVSVFVSPSHSDVRLKAWSFG